jgi:hypothetical protein
MDRYGSPVAEPYTDRDEEVVATVLSADNFWRNMGFDQASRSSGRHHTRTRTPGAIRPG